jgi:hypothetical protein
LNISYIIYVNNTIYLNGTYQNAINFTNTNILNFTVLPEGNYSLSCKNEKDNFYFTSDYLPIYTRYIDNCSVFTNKTINLSYYNTVDSSSLIADNLNYNLIFDFGASQQHLIGTFTNSTSNTFCIYPDIPIFFNYNVVGQLFLQKTNYLSKIYNIPTESPMTAYIGNITPIKIYTTPLNESTSVQFTWLTNNYLAVSGTMYVYLCNGDGTKSLIDSPNIVNSVAYTNLELTTKPYSYTVYFNGQLYEDTQTYSACHIETTDNIIYFLKTDTTDITQPLGMYSIVCNMNKTGNMTFKMTWGNNSESTLPITGCISAYRYGVVGYNQSYLACENTTNFIERTIPDNGFSYDVIGRLYQGGYSIPCDGSLTFQPNNQASLWGLTGLFSVILLILSFALFYAGDDTKMLVGAIIGIVLSWIIGLLAFEWSIITALCAFILIIGLVGRSATKR